MPTLLANIASKIRQVYQKAGDFIEEERGLPVSQVFLNATLKRYVTDNVGLLKDLHADLHEGWLRLYCTVDVAGVYAVLSVDLKLIQMIMNKDTQLIVFEQISNTEVIETQFKKAWLKVAANSALFFYHRILRRDPLGPILQRYNIVQVKDDLLFLDLNRWLGNSAAIIDTLNKVHVNHAELHDTELLVFGNVNVMSMLSKIGVFNRRDRDLEHDLDVDEADDLEQDSSKVSPIQQKD